jgi:hypothetical protein
MPHLFRCSEAPVCHLWSSTARNEAVAPLPEALKRDRRDRSDEDFQPASLRGSRVDGAYAYR